MNTIRYELEYLGTTSDNLGVIFVHVSRDSHSRPFLLIALVSLRDRMGAQLDITEIGYLVKIGINDGEDPRTFLDRIRLEIGNVLDQL